MGTRALPSAFFEAWAEELVASATTRRPVVDLACGRGRHALAAARRGAPVLAVDRNSEFLAALAADAQRSRLPLRAVRADLETGSGIPVKTGSCGSILVFRFLFRPLAPAIQEALEPGGLLLYETFTTAQLRQGWGPSSDAFLLEPGELPHLFPELEVLEFWEGLSTGPKPEAVARLAARRPR